MQGFLRINGEVQRRYNGRKEMQGFLRINGEVQHRYRTECISILLFGPQQIQLSRALLLLLFNSIGIWNK